VLVLFPWNAALWFMAHRLRLAIEIDCDARVIGDSAAEEYGLFLVAVGERRAHGIFLAASLTERRSSLERRIHAMTMLRPRHPLLASFPFAAIALGAAALAAQTPTPPATGAGAVERAAMARRMDTLPLTANQVREIIAAYHPAIANGSSEENLVSIVLASNGEVVLTGATELKEVPVAARAVEERAVAERAVAERAVAERAVAERAAVRATERVVPTEEPPRPAAARAVRVEEVRRDTAPSGPQYWYVPGIGRIDRTLLKRSASIRYAAGVVAPHAINVQIVMLTGNSTGR